MKGIIKMKFMNLFKKSNEKDAICHAKQPNSECSSVEKIRQLQDKVKTLHKEKEKITDTSAYSVIYNIKNSDGNIIKRYSDPYINIHGYRGIKEVEDKWLDFVNLFNSMEDKSKDKIINYLKSNMDLKIKIADYNYKINDLENQIKEEKKKLGIE